MEIQTILINGRRTHPPNLMYYFWYKLKSVRLSVASYHSSFDIGNDITLNL
jgi:hypothetical protein